MFISAAPAVTAAAQPLRIFIGSSRKNRVEEALFRRTILRHAGGPVEINVLDGDDGVVRWQSGKCEPLPGVSSAEGATRFSLARFAIPQLCSFQGRAIYCDSDQLVFRDLAELAATDLGEATAAAVRVADAICAAPYRDAMLAPLVASGEDYYLTSVMLIDCARARNWDIAALQAGIASRQLDYTGVMFLGRRERERLGLRVADLPAGWNSLDRNEPGTALLHFTDLDSQPWLFPHNPARRAWEAEFFGALEEGALTRGHLAAAWRSGGVDLRTLVTALLPAGLRRGAHALWTAALLALSPAQWARRAEDALRRALPETRWYWKRGHGLRALLGWWLRLQAGAARAAGPRILFFIHSLTCERQLLPLVRALCAQAGAGVAVEVVLAGRRDQRRRLLPELRRLGCGVDTDGFAVISALARPRAVLTVLCLDHRAKYRQHRVGVDVADAMRRAGVDTACVQHGGTREDSIASLASTASRSVLVWGAATARALAGHGMDPARILTVGNHLHDRLHLAGRDAARRVLAERFPAFMNALGNRRLLLLATTIQAEYAERADEQRCYERFLDHLYASVDCSRDALMIKFHPYDLRVNRNLYAERCPAAVTGSVQMVRSEEEPDVYTLLQACDVLVTRCSTVAEEALLLGRPVVAFDLDAAGPARGYEHLAQLGRYQRVLLEPGDALRQALAQAGGNATDVERVRVEMTTALDGNSLSRNVQALLALARATA